MADATCAYVAVAVDVDREDGAAAGRRVGDDVLGEGLGPVVLVPRDRVVVVGRRERVDVAVAVDVDREDGSGAVRERRDDALGEGLGPVVLVPRDGVVGVGRREHVDVAVAVDVERENGVCRAARPCGNK